MKHVIFIGMAFGLSTNILNALQEQKHYLAVRKIGAGHVDDRFVDIIGKKIDFSLEPEILYLDEIQNPSIINSLLDSAKQNNNVFMQALLEIRSCELDDDMNRLQRNLTETENLLYRILFRIFACHSTERRAYVQTGIHFLSDYLCFEQITDERPFIQFLNKQEWKDYVCHSKYENMDFFSNHLRYNVFERMRNLRRIRYYEDKLKQRGLLTKNMYLERILTKKVHSSNALLQQVSANKHQDQNQVTIPQQSNIHAPAINIVLPNIVVPENKPEKQFTKHIIVAAVACIGLVYWFYSISKMSKHVCAKNDWMNWTGANLLKDVFVKYTGSDKIEYNDKCAQAFLTDVEHEEKKLQKYLWYAQTTKKLRLNRIFGISEQDISTGSQKLKKLAGIKNTFIDWFVDQKIKLNFDSMKRHGLALIMA